MGSQIPIMNLSDSRHPTMVQKVIELTKELQSKEGMSLDNAFNAAYETIRNEKIREQPPDLVNNFINATNKSSIKVKSPDIKELFD